jgi:hypothetical protein
MAFHIFACSTRQGCGMNRSRAKPSAPPATDEYFDQRVARCKAAWEETRDPFAVAEAHTWHALCRAPSPDWLDQAIVEVCIARRSKAVHKRHIDAMIDFARWNTVRALREPGRKEWWRNLPGKSADALSWDKAYAQAAENLENTAAAGGSAGLGSPLRATICGL